MNCSRILGKYRLQYDFDDLLSGNAEQYDSRLSMGLRVRRPVSVFLSSGVLSVRLDDRTGLSLLGSIFIHVVVIFGIVFIAVQKIARADPAYLQCASLVNAPLKKPENASFRSFGPGIWIRAPV